MRGLPLALGCFVVGYLLGAQSPRPMPAAAPSLRAASVATDPPSAPSLPGALRCWPRLPSERNASYCILQVFIRGTRGEWHGHRNSAEGYPAAQWLNGLYALAHGYHYCVATERLVADGRAPHWQKVLAARRLLGPCENVLVLDTDAAVHDFDLTLERVFGEFLGPGTGKAMAVAVDWPRPWCLANTGVVLYTAAHPRVGELLDAWYRSPLDSTCDPYFLTHHAYEQACFMAAVYPKYAPDVALLRDTFISGEGMFVRHIYWYRGAAAPFEEQLRAVLANRSLVSLLGPYLLAPHPGADFHAAEFHSTIRLPRHRHPNATAWCHAVKRANRDHNLGCGGPAPDRVLHYTAPCPPA